MVPQLVFIAVAFLALGACGQDQCGESEGARVDCGFSGIDEHGCVSKGCCWKAVSPNPSNAPWCFKKAPGPSPGPSPPAPRPLPPAPRPTPPAPRPTPPAPSPTPPPGPSPAHGPLPGCQVFSNNQCVGDEIITADKFEANRWFTPLPGDEDYLPSFQQYGRLVAYAHVAYSDATLTSATVELRATHKDSSVSLSYMFGGKEQASASATFSKEQAGPLSVSVRGADGSLVELDPVDFRWNAPEVKARAGDFRNGQKGALVELFGWPHADIEEECKDLAAMGYLGVKVFPVMEQVMSTEPFQNFMNPWYFMYQPVSYRLQGRMGTRDDLRKMIATCRSVGVRVYADSVVNHMSGGGNDANEHHRNPGAACALWGNKTSSMPGGHSPYYTQSYTYTVGKNTGQAPSQEFPAVPYGPLDFHCERALNSWTDPLDLNAGWLSGLTDLNTERENVQERIAAYYTDLMGIGFSGLRIDAAKHIKPDDLVAILSKFRRNMGGALPVDFFSWSEVLLGGEADLLMCNPQSGYNYGSYFTGKLAAAGFSATEVNQIKTWNSGFPKEPEKGIDDCDPDKSGLQRVVIQNDDHDQQNPGSSSRDMGDTGCVLIKGCDEEEHRGFEVKLFTNPSGAKSNKDDYPIRTVLSSFYWGPDGVEGMPDGKSDCSLCTVNCKGCKSMPYQKAHNPSSKGYDKGDGMYTRVHRDAGIVSAVKAWMEIDADSEVVV